MSGDDLVRYRELEDVVTRIGHECGALHRRIDALEAQLKGSGASRTVEVAPPEPPPDPLFIVADDFSMAYQYAREHGLNPDLRSRQWIYVSGPDTVRGRRGGRFVHLAASDSLRDQARRYDVLTALRHAGFTEVTE